MAETASLKERAPPIIDVDQNSSAELSDKELKKIIQKDTIVYSSIGTKLNRNMLEFMLPQKAGQYRVTVVGISEDGRYGTHTSKLQIEKEFNATLPYPIFIRDTDQIRLTLSLENNSR